MTATITLERLLNPDVNNKANFCRYVAAHRNKRAILAAKPARIWMRDGDYQANIPTRFRRCRPLFMDGPDNRGCASAAAEISWYLKNQKGVQT